METTPLLAEFVNVPALLMLTRAMLDAYCAAQNRKAK